MSVALADPVSAELTAADLVLLRMALPSKTQTSPAKIREDVNKLLANPLSSEGLIELREVLASEGLLTQGRGKSYVISENGREHARRILGVGQFPPRLTWSMVIAKYLFPRAAGVSQKSAAKLKKGEHLAAFALKRRFDLGPNTGSTVNQVLAAIVCKQLGVADEATLEGLLCSVLSKLIGSERLSKDKLANQVPAVCAGLTSAKADYIRQKFVREWLAEKSSSPVASEPVHTEAFDLAAFAATVQALAANSPPQDRFFDNKVFIAPLWRTSQREANFPRLTLDAFKQRLVEANSHRLLSLSRADLVQAMDPQLVSESETTYLNATFHFVRLPENRS